MLTELGDFLPFCSVLCVGHSAYGGDILTQRTLMLSFRGMFSVAGFDWREKRESLLSPYDQTMTTEKTNLHVLSVPLQTFVALHTVIREPETFVALHTLCARDFRCIAWCILAKNGPLNSKSSQNILSVVTDF